MPKRMFDWFFGIGFILVIVSFVFDNTIGFSYWKLLLIVGFVFVAVGVIFEIKNCSKGVKNDFSKINEIIKRVENVCFRKKRIKKLSGIEYQRTAEDWIALIIRQACANKYMESPVNRDQFCQMMLGVAALAVMAIEHMEKNAKRGNFPPKDRKTANDLVAGIGLIMAQSISSPFDQINFEHSMFRLKQAISQSIELAHTKDLRPQIL